MIELLEEFFESARIVSRNLEGYFARNFLQFQNVRNFILEVLFDFREVVLYCLLNNKLIPNTVPLLQKQRAARALNLALGHDSNSVAENVGLVHVMRGEYNNLITLILLQHFPKPPPRRRVHARGRLVEHDDLGVADHGDGDGELSLLAAGESVGLLILLLIQVNINKHFLNLIINQITRRTLKRSKHPQMVLRGQIMKQNIMLRTHTEHRPQLIHVIENIEAKHFGFALCLLEEASKHRQRSRLARPVMPQQRKYLPRVHSQIDTLDRLLLPEALFEASDLHTRLLGQLPFQTLRYWLEVDLFLVGWYVVVGEALGVA